LTGTPIVWTTEWKGWGKPNRRKEG